MKDRLPIVFIRRRWQKSSIKVSKHWTNHRVVFNVRLICTDILYYPVAHLLTILQIGVQGSSPELLSVDQEISVLQSCLFSKHFASRTSFIGVFFPFRWLSMLSSHLIIGLPPGLFSLYLT